MTAEWLFPPGLIMIAGALALPILRGRARAALMLALPLVTLFTIWQVPDGINGGLSFLGYTLHPATADPLSRLFASIFAIAAFAGGLFALNQERVEELSAAYAYAGSAVGVAMAGDLVTLFVFWELMAIGSTLVIWSARTESSNRAAMRYLLMHLLGGVVLLFGVVGYVSETGSVRFTAMEAGSLATWLILVGFLINAAAPPFSAWLADAYPEASWSGMVFLSAFTTKTAVYVLLRGFPGTEILVPIGVFMALYGVIYALIENDVRRMFAYSIVSQVGFMVAAIGIGSELALNAAAAHAVTHIVYKALLLMSVGSIIYRTGKRRFDQMGGLGRAMPLTAAAAIIGAMAVSAVPWMSGFASKSMITGGFASDGAMWAWLALTGASVGTLLYAAIKFPWLVFFRKRDLSAEPVAKPALNQWLAMGLMAAGCVGLGVFPDLLMDLLPYSATYDPFKPGYVVRTTQMMLFAGLAYWLLRRWLVPKPGVSLDFDWFYRGPGLRVARWAGAMIAAVHGAVTRTFMNRLERLLAEVFRHHGPQGALARTWAVGSTVLWVAILLALYLLVYYV